MQQRPLLRLLRRRGWVRQRVYVDRLTGTKQARPRFHALLDDARRGAFDVVLVWRLDRLAPGVRQLVLTLHELGALGIDFFSYREFLDTTTRMGPILRHLIRAMAEAERASVGERVRDGLYRALKHGTRSGRPVGRPKREFDREQVVRLRRMGWSYRRIAAELDLGLGTVSRALKDSQGEP